MNTELLGLVLMFGTTVLLAWPLGIYMSKVYAFAPTRLDWLFNGLERLIYRLGGVNPTRQMTWQQHLIALLTINLCWFFYAMIILMNQGWLPLNPDGVPSMSPDLAFNTAISFLVNCNLQHYSGETGMSYLGQMACLMFLQFVTAATGMATCVVVFKAMKSKASEGLGNFYGYFVRSCTRILLPISLVTALILLACGSPMTFEPKASITTLQGDAVQVARGPAAAMIAIKQAGTNGGGFFGVNSAHPLENPSYFSNVLENVLILLIPIALVFALGHFLQRRRLSWMILGVMTLGFVLLLVPTVMQEMQGNPAISALGIEQSLGSLEGKEMRLGAAASAYWGISTTVTSNGSVNAMHDSFTALSGAFLMLGMMLNALYGGVGVGLLNFYVFIILAVFIAGLMVGRTPEFLGKKVEAREMKIAMMIALLHPLLILVGTALASFVWVNDPSVAWLNNPGFHGFSEMLYEYTSSAANNGSGFEGLGDNTPFWNITTGIVLILSRYIPIIGPVAIAGLLANKKSIPESAGTLPTDTPTFGIMVLAVMFIIAALSFFPALTLGPIAEFFAQ
jgi:potassium-transporting ATPase potassium-binding subunit